MTTYKTPGVYVREMALFPPSVAEVATAIPAFIGYTAFASDEEGNLLNLIPAKVRSLLEFETLFGGAFIPDSYNVYVDPAGPAADSVSADVRFYLYDSLRLFYDNGGGECYIVSVGIFSEAKLAGIKKGDLEKGIQAVAALDEPTLILFPDAVAMGGDDRFTDMGNLQQTALAQCARLQDRFTIMDLMDGFRAAEVAFDPVSVFRQEVGMNNLSYGAAYYPWLKTSFLSAISWDQLKFFKKGTEDVFDPSAELAADPLFSVFQAAKNDQKSVSDKLSAVSGDSDDIGAALDVTVKAIKEAADEAVKKQKLTDYLKILSSVAVYFPLLESAAGAELKKTLEVLKRDKNLQDTLKMLIGFEKSGKITSVLNDNTAASVKSAYASLDKSEWIGKAKYTDIAADDTNYAAGEQLKVITAMDAAKIRPRLIQTFQKIRDDAALAVSLSEKALMQNHPLFSGALSKITDLMRLIPASGAIAGIYAATDRTRGVWKAPANVSINSVVGPAVKIDSREQEEMNVHTSGKSVNAIRAFTGRGVLVWGSRTLAGNDNEWKYVPVRRFFNMVEESVKKAGEPFIFEPNDKNTWVKVKAMIENYLILLWRAGALQGAKPEEAFFVAVGLGETMTALDLLEGRMIVEIGLAAVRPSEFIILRFSHKMMETTSNS
ncbi:MAG: phage tail sheath C-terminal domain-containing protein [Prolixibacteraceae bacterium]